MQSIFPFLHNSDSFSHFIIPPSPTTSVYYTYSHKSIYSIPPLLILSLIPPPSFPTFLSCYCQSFLHPSHKSMHLFINSDLLPPPPSLLRPLLHPFINRCISVLLFSSLFPQVFPSVLHLFSIHFLFGLDKRELALVLFSCCLAKKRLHRQLTHAIIPRNTVFPLTWNSFILQLIDFYHLTPEFYSQLHAQTVF